MPPQRPTIFHLASRAEFEAAQAAKRWRPASLDGEGFVHACFRGQFIGVTERYYRGARGLVLVELDPTRVGRLKVEAPPGSDEGFPHVYGELPLSAVRRVFDVEPADDGSFRLPAELQAEAARDEERIEALLASFAWYDHPEGPKFVETQRDEHRTCGHWLFLPGALSAFHRVLNNDELWIAQDGRLTVHVVTPTGEHVAHTLGTDVASGERPVLEVPRGHWQAAELCPGEPYAFGANVCAPPFEFDRFELTPRAELLARWPQHAELVSRLTH